MRSGNLTKKLIVVMLLVAMMVTVSGCSTFNNFKKIFIDKDADIEDPVITIGVLEPDRKSTRLKSSH